MNKELIRRYNEVVGEDDTVYFLGDISFGSPGKTHEVLHQLKGTKYLILGNHDKHFRKKEDLQAHFEWCKDYAEVTIQDPQTNKPQLIVLCHYAMKVWNQRHRGAWQLYGHSHGNMPDDPNSLQIDVGVDCHDYRPICFEEVKMLMENKTSKPVDHHGSR